MNSLEQLEREKATSSVPVQLRSNWVELFAIPIAAAIMETQPIVLVLQLFQPQLEERGVLLPGALIVTLPLLLMQWWAMFLHARGKLQGRNGRATLRSLCGIPVMVLLLAFLRPAGLEEAGFLFFTALLAAWTWYRGVLRAREPLSDDYLTAVFRVGFAALLVVMALAVIAGLDGEPRPVLGEELMRSLPIFFLSGLISLSFTRIGKLKREQQRHPGSAGREATGRWLTGLTGIWVALVIVAVALEGLPLALFLTMLTPFWTALLWVGTGILYLISLVLLVVLTGFGYILKGVFWLFQQIFGHGGTANTWVAKTQQDMDKVAPAVIKGGQQSPLLMIGLAAVVLVVAVLVFFSLTRKKGQNSEAGAEEEEVRESLNREEILQERRKRKRKQQDGGVTLEALDAASMRARYREFLQQMAEQGEETQRRPSETPLEYQRRLLTIAGNRGLFHGEREKEILGELTLAYAQERYGGRPVDSEVQGYLGSRVPRLVQKFAGSVGVAAKPVAPWSAAKSRWGED
jgi:hypothetical protein